MAELAAVTTHIAPADMLLAMSAAWATALGRAPAHEQICTLVAQWALETGGGRECMNFNVGNFKSTPVSAADFTFFSTYERVSPTTARAQLIAHPNECSWDGQVDDDGLAKLIVHPRHPWSCFRAYRSLAGACGDYLHRMYTDFALAWPAATAGDPAAFAAALHTVGYYTSAPGPYAVGCVSWFHRLMAMPWTEPLVAEAALPAPIHFAIDPRDPPADPENA